MNEKNVYLHHFLLSREFFQFLNHNKDGRKCGRRRDIVDLQGPLRCVTPNLSFILPPSSSGTSCSTQAPNGTKAVSRLICLRNGTVYI